MSKRGVLLYTSGKTGLGHLARFSRVAAGLASRMRGKVPVIVVSGVPPSRHSFEYPGVQHVFLPEIAGFTRWGVALRLQASSRDNVARALRRVIAEIEPDVFVTSHYAGICGELWDVYDSLHDSACRVVLALRDIYDFVHDTDVWPDLEELRTIIETYVDQVVVLGTPATSEWLPPYISESRTGAPLVWLGYVAPITEKARESPHRRSLAVGALKLLCQSGGGWDGARLAELAVASLPFLRLGGRRVELDIILGPFMPSADQERIRNICRSQRDTQVLQYIRLDQDVLARYSAQIAMSGYNTCVEAAYYGIPSVLVPRNDPADAEQRTRALMFAARFEFLRCDRNGEWPSGESLAVLLNESIHSFSQKPFVLEDGTFFGRNDIRSRVVLGLAAPNVL